MLLIIFLAPTYASAAKSPDAKLVNRHTVQVAHYAPPAVKKMVRAANRISNKPYLWGGGHGSFNSRGYDCSGAVSYVLRAGGFLKSSLTSGSLASWGKRGTSRWFTVYANSGHTFMKIAGIRFDTGYLTDGDKSGPGWSLSPRPQRGFAVRSLKLTSKKQEQSSSGGLSPGQR